MGTVDRHASRRRRAVCLWLPDRYRKPDTSVYVQGVELPLEDNRPVPEGFDAIELPPPSICVFRASPFRKRNMAAR